MQHCPSNCHQHTIQSFTGVASGSFTAPDHEYPSYLELRLTATDAGGLTDTETLRLDPQTVTLNFASSPSGLQLVVGSTSAATPFSRTVIIGSANSVSAVSPQTARRHDVRVLVLVQRWRPDAHDHRTGRPGDVHRDVRRLAGTAFPRRLVFLRRRQRPHARGHLGSRTHGHDLGRDLVGSGQEWRRALVRRRQRLGHGRRYSRARPLDGDDAGGLGAADVHEPLADGRAQGADRKPRLCPLRQQQRPAGQRESLAGLQREGGTERGPAGRKRLDAPGGHLRRRGHPRVRERRALRVDGHDRLDARLHRAVPDRWQCRLGRVLRGPARRPPPLQPRPLGDRGPDGHGDPGRAASAERYAGPDRAGRARRDRRPELGDAQLDGFERQHQRAPVQRPPQHDLGLHAERGQPHRAAHGHGIHRPRSRARDVLLPGHRRRRRRERQRALDPGERRRDGRRHAAGSPRHAAGDRRARHRQSLLDCRHGQRRRRALQRAPLHGRGLRPRRLEPDCAADGHELHRHRRRRHLLLPRDRGGRRRQYRRPLERGQRDRDERHVGPDRRGHRPRGRADGLGHDQRAGERVRQRRRHERPVHPRRSGARRPRHERAVRHLVGDDDRHGRPAHAPCGRERRRRQLDDVGGRDRDGRQQRRRRRRPGSSQPGRSTPRDRPPPTPPARATRGRSRARPGRPRARTAAHSRSTASTTGSPSPMRTIST